MNGLKFIKNIKTQLLVLTIAIGITGLSPLNAQALVRYEFQLPNGESLTIKDTNKKREKDQLILYTPSFGPSTRTRQDGVEVAIVPVNGKANTFEVKELKSVWDCQKDKKLTCGNMAIPKEGYVLSADGKQKDYLFNRFLPGTQFSMRPLYRFESQFPVSIIDPTEASNPVGKGFPGLRGGNQLIIYTPNYNQLTTGTNEFGFEVTACGNRITTREGANSEIPKSGECFIISGHGKAKDWILENLPEGAQVWFTENNTKVNSAIDDKTYFEQTKSLARSIAELSGKNLPTEYTERLTKLELQNARGASDTTISQLLVLKDELEKLYWKSFPIIYSNNTKGIWYRPKDDSKEAIKETISKFKQAGLNRIYLETYLHGDPIFTSKTFQRYGIKQTLPFKLKDAPNEDLLKVWLDEAHAQGLKVSIWFQTFYAGNLQANKSRGGIIEAHPDWANVQFSSINRTPIAASTQEPGAYFLDPANPEVKTFLLSFIDEIITNYDIDGFQLDYIRYPASLPPDKYNYLDTTWGYSNFARKQFSQLYSQAKAEQLVAEDTYEKREATYKLLQRNTNPNLPAVEKKPKSQKADKKTKAKPLITFTQKDKTTLATILEKEYDPVNFAPNKDKANWQAWQDYKTEQVTAFVKQATDLIQKKKPTIERSAAIFPNNAEAVIKKHQNWQEWLDKGYLTAIAPMTLTSSIDVVGNDTSRMVNNTDIPVTTGIFGPFNGNEATDVIKQIWGAYQNGAKGIVLFEGNHLTEAMIEALGGGLFRSKK